MSQFTGTKFRVIQRGAQGRETHGRGAQGGLVQISVEYKSKWFTFPAKFNKGQIERLLTDPKIHASNPHAELNAIMRLFDPAQKVNAGGDSYTVGHGNGLYHLAIKKFAELEEFRGAKHLTHLLTDGTAS